MANRLEGYVYVCSSNNAKRRVYFH